MPLSNKVLTQQIIDKQILQHLEEKPQCSIFKSPLDVYNNNNDENIQMNEPDIPSSTILNISSFKYNDNTMICNNININHIHQNQYNSILDINFFNFKADYKHFSSNYKIYVSFNISIQSLSKLSTNPSFNILIKPSTNIYDNKFDTYNLYSKINSIDFVSKCAKSKRYIYNIKPLILHLYLFLIHLQYHQKVIQR
eukprot:229275_1